MFKALPSYFLAAAMAALPVASMAKSVSPEHDSSKAMEILKDFEAKAADTADQAAFLDANLRSPSVGWESYTIRLQALKDDINDMGRTLARLEGMRATLSPVDREVIDRAGTVLKELADNTTASVNAINQNHESLWIPMWHKYTSNLMSESSQLSNSVSRAIELDKTRAREQHLEKAIETPGQ